MFSTPVERNVSSSFVARENIGLMSVGRSSKIFPVPTLS